MHKDMQGSSENCTLIDSAFLLLMHDIVLTRLQIFYVLGECGVVTRI